MEWTQSDTLALAVQECTQCLGIGMRKNARKDNSVCNCVYRSIFRACFARFRQCITKEKRHSHVVLEYSARGGRRITWGRKDEEYIADFLLVSRRYLTEDEYKVFKYYFLLGADWRLCCPRLAISKGNFYSIVYRIEERLGRIFRELKPYSLYPLDEYFNGRTENQTPSAVTVEDSRNVTDIGAGRRLVQRIKVPVRRAA